MGVTREQQSNVTYISHYSFITPRKQKEKTNPQNTLKDTDTVSAARYYERSNGQDQGAFEEILNFR